MTTPSTAKVAPKGGREAGLGFDAVEAEVLKLILLAVVLPILAFLIMAPSERHVIVSDRWP